MPRARRLAPPGSLHHVMNRGVGRRPIFETEQDVRAFLALLALAVRARLLELHAFTVLATHYHLLVRCPNGELSEALQWIQDMYARWFNRTRGRDGHVFQGRFISRRIEDPVYYVTVVAYIDDNPCAAGMAQDPREYAHGSARWYATARGPRWLHRALVEDHVRALARFPTFRAVDYPVLWRTCAAWSGELLAARSLFEQRVAVAPLLDLTRAGPEHVQRWLRQNALNEAGGAAACLLLPAHIALALVCGSEAEVRPRGRPRSGQPASHGAPQAAGLLRSGCGLRLKEIAGHMGVSLGTVSRYLGEHGQHMAGDPGYASAFAAVMHAGLVRAYGRVCDAEFPDLTRGLAASRRRREMRKLGQTPGVSRGA